MASPTNDYTVYYGERVPWCKSMPSLKLCLNYRYFSFLKGFKLLAQVIQDMDHDLLKIQLPKR